MPLFATFVGSLFSALAKLIGETMAKRVLIIGAVIAGFVVSAGIFGALVQSLINQVSASAPAGWAAYGLSLLPSNTDDCLAAIVAVEIAAWAHQWQVKVLSTKAL